MSFVTNQTNHMCVCVCVCVSVPLCTSSPPRLFLSSPVLLGRSFSGELQWVWLCGLELNPHAVFLPPSTSGVGREAKGTWADPRGTARPGMRSGFWMNPSPCSCQTLAVVEPRLNWLGVNGLYEWKWAVSSPLMLLWPANVTKKQFKWLPWKILHFTFKQDPKLTFANNHICRPYTVYF